MVQQYEEHTGINFYGDPKVPLLCSGGDDYRLIIYNYKLRRRMFTLLGHLDYIRTVQFCYHGAGGGASGTAPSPPWLVSASDDQTIRIWNWQARTCISVLTGHNHYVMCASFHPREDYIVSASLDQTVRVWDVSGLRRKSVRGAPADEASTIALAGRATGDLFGSGDAVVKYVLEGHERGVNWAAFHPTQNLIVSGADDRHVKLWRMNETKAWEMDTLRGHNNNVSCVMFHPKHDLVISNSEDRSIRVWDVQKRMCIQTFRRENDRFWILAVHPDQNLIAAGHDTGMLVFKLERERPAYGVKEGQLFYVRDRYLRRYVLGTGSDVPLVSLRARGGSASGLGTAPRTLVPNPFNPTEEDVLIISPVEGGTYELFNLNQSAEIEPARGACVAAVFTARNKFAVLDKTRQIIVRTTSNDPGKRAKSPYSNVDMIFQSATPGRLLVRSDDRICLFELASQRVVAEITGIAVRYVSWSADGAFVALMGKHAVVLADRDLNQICSVTETVRVKSGCWDADNGVFLFTTLNHLKYLLPLPSGDCGIVRTMDAPVYAVDCRGNTLYVVDRDSKTRSIPIDPTEHSFKLALARRQFDRVLSIIKTARLCGQAVIAYLQKAGYPEIALFFVEDELTRFNLALECGNLDIALKAARALNEKDAWERLAAEALRQGNIDVVEVAYQTIKAFDKLSFLYLIAGASDKLGKMLTIAGMRGDPQSRFHNALYLGNVEERVKVLESAGQVALAYTTAATYGLEADATRLKGLLEAASLPVPEVLPSASALLPPTPILRSAGSWPMVATSKVAFDPAAVAAVAAAAKDNATAAGADSSAAVAAAAVAAAAAASAAAAAPKPRAAAAADQSDEAAGGGGWADDDDLGLGPDALAPAADDTAAADGGGWGDDLDLGGDVAPSAAAPAAVSVGGTGFLMPAGGTSVPSYWASNSSVAGDHVAAGSFETAMQLLNRQIGVVNFAPMQANFMAGYAGARASIPVQPGVPSLPIFLSRNELDQPAPRERTLPITAISLASLQDRARLLLKVFTEGKFPEAQDVADTLFAALPLVVVNTKTEVAEVRRILSLATEYKTALRMLIAGRSMDATKEPGRQIELAAYVTHCKLEPAHLMLALNLAMGVAFKQENFIHAAGFARRLMEMPDINSAKNAALLTKVKAVLQRSEAQARNAHRINYDDRTPFDLCAGSFTPIYRGSEVVRAPYSGAPYLPQYRGSVCVIDGMSHVGVETLGLVCSNVQSRS